MRSGGAGGGTARPRELGELVGFRRSSEVDVCFASYTLDNFKVNPLSLPVRPSSRVPGCTSEAGEVLPVKERVRKQLC